MIFRFYDRTVAEGKNFLIFAVILAVVIRLVYYLHADIAIPVVHEGGYLWDPLATFFSNRLYSLLGSSVMIALLSGTLYYINAKHAFIRRRTMLPSAIVVLLFSCSPTFVAMSPYYIAAFCMVLIVNTLFEAQTVAAKQWAAYKITFYLALGSLFAPILLIYLPILWICLIRVRSFNFKALLASLFAVFILYLPTFSYFFFVDDLDQFIKPFIDFANIDWTVSPIFSYSLLQLILLGAYVILFFMVVVDNSINSYKDKIRVRTFLAVLSIIILFSLLCTVFLNFECQSTLYIALVLGALQLAHFFSLAEKRITAIIFLIYFIFLVVVSILSIVN